MKSGICVVSFQSGVPWESVSSMYAVLCFIVHKTWIVNVSFSLK